MSGGCFDGGSSSGSKKRQVVHQVNDYLVELPKPEGTPSMEIVLFHGLNLGESSDAHLSTWEAEDGSIWPQKWLVEEYPAAQIFTGSYSGTVVRTSHKKFGMDLIVESLISDVRDANIGQTPYCPVVLVGHSFGGLVIKQLCVESRRLIFSRREDEMAPHHGSPLVSPQAAERNSPVLKYFRIVNTEGEQLNFEFDGLCRSHPKCQVGGLGESLPTESGVFQGVVAAAETSSRQGDFFSVDATDHISISKPSNKKDRRFYAFTGLLETIARNSEEEKWKQEKAVLQEARPQNFQCLPESMVNVDAEVDQIMSKPETVISGFGHLANLNDLRYYYYRELPTLPNSFWYLATTLNHLESQTLPNSFENLVTMNHVSKWDCGDTDCVCNWEQKFRRFITEGVSKWDCGDTDCVCNWEQKSRRFITEGVSKWDCGDRDCVRDWEQKFRRFIREGVSKWDCGDRDCVHDWEQKFRRFITEGVSKWDCGDRDCVSDWEQKFRRFITEVTDESANGYFVSKIWLSSLDEHHWEKVMSVLGGAGYFEIYQTRTTMFYERIEDEIHASTICNDSETDDTKVNFPNSQTNQGETFSRSNNGNVVGEAGSSTASQGSGDSLRDDLQSMGIAAKVSGVENATEASPKIHAKCECPLQRLTVSMRTEAGPSTSSSQVKARIPVGEQFKMFTGVDKDISMKTPNFTGSLEVDVPLRVSTQIGLSCCVTSDRKNVRIHFEEIRGEVTVGGGFDRRTNALALKSLRTNVNASINPGPENIRLDIKGNNSPPPWRRVLDTYQPFDNNGERKRPEDLMWLDLTGERPKNSIVGSRTLEFQQHVKNRLKIDLDEDSERALVLYFDGSPPVTFEGDIHVDLDPNSFLELHVRHEVEISYNVVDHPRPTADAISAFTTRVNRVVEFDCVLEFRTQKFSSQNPVG